MIPHEITKYDPVSVDKDRQVVHMAVMTAFSPHSLFSTPLIKATQLPMEQERVSHGGAACTVSTVP